MDPDATLRKLVDAINEKNPADAQDAASDLVSWLEKGGSLPTANRTVLRDALGYLCGFVMTA